MMRICSVLPSLSSAVALVVLIAVTTTGCAGFGPPDAGKEAEGPPLMDQARLEQIFSDQVEAITGPTGVLQTRIDDIPVYCISDPTNDRMRIIAPVARMSDLNPRLLEILLRANFHNALDARYAISEDVVFSAFVHPISSLSPDLIASAVSQVVSLVKTFGTTFSSSEDLFPKTDSGASEEEANDEVRNPSR